MEMEQTWPIHNIFFSIKYQIFLASENSHNSFYFSFCRERKLMLSLIGEYDLAKFERLQMAKGLYQMAIKNLVTPKFCPTGRQSFDKGQFCLPPAKFRNSGKCC